MPITARLPHMGPIHASYAKVFFAIDPALILSTQGGYAITQILPLVT
jgi:hypothetical protein